MGSTITEASRPVPGAKSLRANFSWTFAGNVVNTLSQFGMLLVLARLGNAEMVGQYGLGLAMTAPVFLLANMSMRNVQVTDVRNEHAFIDYATLRGLMLVTGLLVVAVLVMVPGYDTVTAAVVMLIGLSKCIEGLSDVIFGVFHKHERMDLIARSMMVKGCFTLVVFGAVLWGTDSIIASVASISMVWLGRLLLFDIPNLIRLRGWCTALDVATVHAASALQAALRQRDRLAALLLLCLPVGISSALISLNTNIPRYVIEWTGGSADLGVFTVLAYPLVAGNTVVSALSQSSLPRLARYHAQSDSTRFLRLIARLMLLAGGLGLVALVAAQLVGEEVLKLAFGEEYAAEHTVFVSLVFGMGIGFLNWFLNSSLYAMRAFRLMLAIQLATIVFVALMSILLVPHYGLFGAALVVVASNSMQFMVKSLSVVGLLRAKRANMNGRESTIN